MRQVVKVLLDEQCDIDVEFPDTGREDRARARLSQSGIHMLRHGEHFDSSSAKTEYLPWEFVEQLQDHYLAYVAAAERRWEEADKLGIQRDPTRDPGMMAVRWWQSVIWAAKNVPVT